MFNQIAMDIVIIGLKSNENLLEWMYLTPDEINDADIVLSVILRYAAVGNHLCRIYLHMNNDATCEAPARTGGVTYSSSILEHIPMHYESSGD